MKLDFIVGRFGTERVPWSVRQLYALGDGSPRSGLWHVWHNLPAVLVAGLLWEECRYQLLCRPFGHKDTEGYALHVDGSLTPRAVCIRCKRWADDETAAA